MNDYSKRIKRLLREFAVKAYEKELSRELALLDESFSDWREKKINSDELSDRIHKYEIGPSRSLFNKYNKGEDDFNVAYAIIAGILEREDIPEELIQAIGNQLSLYQSMKDDGKLRILGA